MLLQEVGEVGELGPHVVGQVGVDAGCRLVVVRGGRRLREPLADLRGTAKDETNGLYKCTNLQAKVEGSGDESNNG